MTFEWFSIQVLVNAKIFKLSLNLFLTHLRAQIACYELKGDLSPVKLKTIFHDSFENFEIYKDLYVKPCKRTSLGGNSCFSHTNASNFRRPLQLLLLRYTAENNGSGYLILICSFRVVPK